jgi:protocatechuate 3,4-dioxygenase beta subunit
MIRSLTVFVLAAASLSAGVVEGTVQEFASGYPLSRTVVQLVPVPHPDNVNLKVLHLRSASAGQFVFINVPDGYYFLIATRNGYFPGAYGQRRPNGQGTPILITKDTDLFAQLRMHRKGAVTGRVLDENGVGMEGVPVVAYRARLPLRVAGEGVSDDRGVYRIHGLDAGKYWIRSTAHTLEDGSGLLPTFGPQSREVREARAHEVRLDDDTPDADVHPDFGALFQIGGAIQCLVGQVKVTLTSETLHRTTQVPCGSAYAFPSLSPALYEINAQNLTNPESGYTELYIDKATTNADIKLQPPPSVQFQSNLPVTLTGRRHALYDSGTEQPIDTPRADLLAGHWEISGQSGPDHYIQSITNAYGPARSDQAEKAVEWFDVFIEMRPQVQVRITVGDRAAQISGTITKDAKGVPGAPVFLWPLAEAGRRSLKGYRMTIADTDGKYQFTGLPPGDYRMLATYDFTEIDEASLDEGLALTIHADEGQRTSADLPLWVSP